MTTQKKKVSTRALLRMAAAGEPIVVCTAYDALFGRLVDEAGVDVILVGDSLGMTVLGYENTIPVTLDQMLHHTAAVSRSVTRAMVVGDMPFMTYHLNPEQALTNAARFLQEAGADAVKLEGGARMAPIVERLVRSGIPVLGHIGILPQAVLVDGGYHVRGRTPEEAEKLKEDARAIAQAGAFGIVLEGLPTDLGGEITEALAIPTIGIGAGPKCSGQVQVIHDILGLFEEFVPRHTRQYASLANTVRNALTQYCADVRGRAFPGKEQSFS